MNLKRAFTLVELLVVIAIVVVLISVLVPSLYRARRQSQSTICLGNLRQIGVGCQMYAQESDNVTLPHDLGNGYTWYDYTGKKYVTDEAHWQHNPLFRRIMGISEIENLTVQSGADWPKDAVWRGKMMCPSSGKMMTASTTFQSYPGSYGINHENTRRPQYAPYDGAYIKLTQVSRPWLKFRFADGLHWEMVYTKGDRYIDEFRKFEPPDTSDPSDFNGVAAYRHGDQYGTAIRPERYSEMINLLFFDGHAEPMSRMIIARQISYWQYW